VADGADAVLAGHHAVLTSRDGLKILSTVIQEKRR
jgi:hypothetical protein